MPVSATASKYRTNQVLMSEELADFAGGTPLIQLRRSGDGQVWVKHEGLQPGGSFFDRVAQAQFEKLPKDHQGIVLDDTTSFAVSALTLAASQQVPATVLIGPDDPQRLVALIKRLTSDVRTYQSEQERAELIASLEEQGRVRFDRHDNAAHLHALTIIALEGLEASDRPLASWVLVDYGIPHDEVTQTMRRVLGHPIRIYFIADDKEKERKLCGSALSRRAQVGHREGLLVGPVASEVIDRAVDVALTSGERVCAIIPDGGQRYLGWW